jgi:hypothetical protein
MSKNSQRRTLHQIASFKGMSFQIMDGIAVSVRTTILKTEVHATAAKRLKKK